MTESSSRDGAGLRIAVVAQGRFHTFDLSRALVAQGHDVRLFTNYSRYEVAKFGISADRVESFYGHRVFARALRSLPPRLSSVRDRVSHEVFGRWVAGRIGRLGSFDAIYCMSGVAKEAFGSTPVDRAVKVLARGSSHIRVQREILSRLEAAVGHSVEHPSRWILEREQAEYKAADRVVVLSSFAADTFTQAGFPSERLWLIPSASDSTLFGVPSGLLEARIGRLLSGERLRVLFAGTFSYRKGAATLAHVVRKLSARMDFTIVGTVDRDCAGLAESLSGKARFIGRIAHHALPSAYREADVFLFPTIEDGYPATLAQAIVSGLIVVASQNCSAPDLIRDGMSGRIVSAMDDDAFVEAIEGLDGDRRRAESIVRESARSIVVRSWENMAADLSQRLTSLVTSPEVRVSPSRAVRG